MGTLLVNIKLGCWCVTVPNTPAFYDHNIGYGS